MKLYNATSLKLVQCLKSTRQDSYCFFLVFPWRQTKRCTDLSYNSSHQWFSFSVILRELFQSLYWTSFKRQWIHSLRVLWELMDNQCSIVLSPSKVPVQHWQPKVYYQQAKLKSQQALCFVFLQSRSSEWLPGKNLISTDHPKQSRVQHW